MLCPMQFSSQDLPGCPLLKQRCGGNAGCLDAGLRLQSSLAAPAIGGDVRFSRGVASLLPGGGPAAGGPSSSSGGSGGGTQQQAMDAAGGLLRGAGRGRENDLVFKAFTVLTRKDALARQLSRLDLQQVRRRAQAGHLLSSIDVLTCSRTDSWLQEWSNRRNPAKLDQLTLASQQRCKCRLPALHLLGCKALQ